MTEMEKLFEKMLNMELTNEEMFEQCRNVAYEPMTNEQWFCSLPTEEKAKRIINIAVNSDCDYRTIVKWLKQPHRNE